MQCAQGAVQGSMLTALLLLPSERGDQELCDEYLPFSLVFEYSCFFFLPEGHFSRSQRMLLMIEFRWHSGS